MRAKILVDAGLKGFQSFFGCKPDWIKYFDMSTGLGLDRITERKFWTGLGIQKSPICSTLVANRSTASTD